LSRRVPRLRVPSQQLTSAHRKEPVLSVAELTILDFGSRSSSKVRVIPKGILVGEIIPEVPRRDRRSDRRFS